MLLGRPGWPAVQTEIVEALTFRGCCQSPCADGQASRPAPLHGKCGSGGIRAAREKSLRGGWGGGLGETEGKREKAGPAHNGAPVAAPRRTMRPPGPAVVCAGLAAALQLPLQNKAVQMCPLDSKSS